MRYLIAWGFKFLFKIKFIRYYYFAIYKRLFKPTNLFKGVSIVCKYNRTLKIKADLDDWIQQNIFFTGIYDSISVGFIKRTLEAEDIFIDIGANIGCFTLIGSVIVGRKGRVIAFEPVDIVSEKLEKNISLNKLENITIERKAVYEKNTTLQLHIANQENLGMSSLLRHDSESGRIMTVEAITLDSYLKSKNIETIKLIKLDIEGAELSALRGMVNTIARFKPVFMVEISPNVLKSWVYRIDCVNA